MAQGKFRIVPQVQSNSKTTTPVNQSIELVVINGQLTSDPNQVNPGVVINRLM